MAGLPEERRKAMTRLRETINAHLPKEFSERMSYGMIGWVIPHKLYPDGYHCDPKLPLPFMNLASQKNFIALYNMGIYGSPKLLEWFTTEYAKQVKSKLDMGKSCIRFKKMDQIPYDLIGELCTKFTAQDWIDCYERNYKSKLKGN